MKHMQADKYTIAWFKIAECVSRGEKERALGVYRLLSHSFNDDAISRQLEADIYLFCNEQERAIFLYRQAIELYKKSKRLMEAAAISEHLILLLPQDLLLRQELIICYDKLGLAAKIYAHAQFLIEAYIRNNQWHDIEQFAQVNDVISDPVARGIIYQHIIVATHMNGGRTDLVMMCIEKAALGLLEGHEQALQAFLATLSALDKELHQYALDCLEKE
jgi:tetratricopeptide (TPR) repeat protein